MMRLVVEHDDLSLIAQLAADAPHHLVRRLREWTGAVRSEDGSGRLVGRLPFAKLEGVIVRDDELGFAKLVHQMPRHDVERSVVVVRVVWQQDAQSVANRDARRDDQE